MEQYTASHNNNQALQQNKIGNRQSIAIRKNVNTNKWLFVFV